MNVHNPQAETAAKLQQFGKHARWAYAMMLFWVIVTPIAAQQLLFQVTSYEVEHWLTKLTLDNWVNIYLGSLAFVFCLVETAGAALQHKGEEKVPLFVKVAVKELAVKAGLPKAPDIIYKPNADRLNAAANRSFLFGRAVALYGKVGKLKQEELYAVLAHEIAHLKMRDVRANHFAVATLFALRAINFSILVGTLIAALVLMEQGLTWLLFTAFIVTTIGNAAARLFYLKYSRVVEYRADAVAIMLTSDHYREHLVRALKKVREISLAMILRRPEHDDMEWSKTHPSTKNRARMLGLIKRLVAPV